MNFWNRSILFVDWVWDFPPPRKIFQSGKIVCTVETGRGLSLEDEIVTINWERAFFSNYFYPETNILQWMKVYIKGFFQWSWPWSWHHGFHKPCWFLLPPKTEVKFYQTRQKPPYGRQGLARPSGKDTVRRVQFGVFSTSRLGPPSLRGEVVIVQESFDNSCQWRSRLRTPWRLWAQTLTSMANA